MDFDLFCELNPKAKFVKIINFDEEELHDENTRKKNKAPLNSLKDPLDIAQAKNWVSRGGRLGWIVPKGMIVIDVDNKDHPKSSEVVKRLLDNHSVQYWYNNSKQGTHFIFKNTSDIMVGKGQFQGYINHIGIQTDGRADGKGYIILPVNDEHFRSWGEYKENIDDLPFWLRPLRPRKDTDVSFIDMPDGVGNDALFKLRGAMTGPNLVTEEESIECLRIINLEIWDTPMDESAFEASIARPAEKTYGNMQQQDGTGSKNDKPKSWLPVAQALIDKFNLIAVGDYVYKYDNGVYFKLSYHELQTLIHKEGYLEATKSNRDEIINFICVAKQVNSNLLDQDYACIPVNNGYLDLMNLKLIEPSPDLYNTVKIDIDFNENCQFSERIDDFMKFISSGDPIKMQLLYELAGYCLLRRNKFQKFFILCGNGGTGKSTFVNIIKRMFRDEYVSNVALSQFDQDYHLSTLIGSMVNIDDDASSDKVLKDAGRFKSITVGNPVLVRPIYSEPVKLYSTATIIICANEMPKIMDSSEGLYRRLMLIELNNKIKNPDRDFEDKITKLDMEYFFYKACEGIHNVLKRGHFIKEESDAMLKQRFKVQQSSIHRWCQLEFVTPDTLINRGLKTIYQDYKLWCGLCGYNTFNYGNFTEVIISLYQLEVQYDRGMGDQVVISSGKDHDWCPFDLNMKGGYLA